MKQYCRYCCYLRDVDGLWCGKQERAVTGEAARSPNRCHDFAPDPVAAKEYGEETARRVPRKVQCDGQMRIF